MQDVPDTESRPIGRTAQRVPFYRAQHQLLDAPAVLSDAVASAMLDDGVAATLTGHDDAAARGRRAFFPARARCAEDAVADAVQRGVHQYVVIGADFDTFAYRHPHSGLVVFEVDRPEMQRLKRQRLHDREIDDPTSVRFVGLDLEHEGVVHALVAAGFDSARPGEGGPS